VLGAAGSQFDLVPFGGFLDQDLGAVVLEERSVSPAVRQPADEPMLPHHQAVDQAARQERVLEPHHQIIRPGPLRQLRRLRRGE